MPRSLGCRETVYRTSVDGFRHASRRVRVGLAMVFFFRYVYREPSAKEVHYGYKRRAAGQRAWRWARLRRFGPMSKLPIFWALLRNPGTSRKEIVAAVDNVCRLGPPLDLPRRLRSVLRSLRSPNRAEKANYRFALACVEERLLRSA